MRPTQKLTKTLNHVLSGLGLLAIFSTGCAGLKPFPADSIIEYDNKHHVCGFYRITSYENLTFEYVKDIPCPSIFGFTSKDIPKILDWANDAQKYAKAHCQ